MTISISDITDKTITRIIEIPSANAAILVLSNGLRIVVNGLDKVVYRG